MFLLSGPLSAQETTGTDQATSHWFATAGFSSWTVELGESGRSHSGVRLGGGVAMERLELGVDATLWSTADNWLIYGLEAQSAVPFGVGVGAAFDVVLGFGWTRSEFIGERAAGLRYIEQSGAVSTVGLQFRLHTRTGWGGRSGVFLRGDLGGFSGEWRTSLSLTEDGYVLAPGPGPGVTLGARLVQYVGVAGPWGADGPAYRLQLRRPVGDAVDATLAASFMFVDGPYNTGAVILQPAAEWRSGTHRRLAFRAGPGIVLMPEGNDSGTTLGPSVEVETGWDVAGLRLRVGSGAMWTWRWHDPDLGDQLWWSLFAGLGP